LFEETSSIVVKNDCENIYTGIVDAPVKKGLFRKKRKKEDAI